MVAIAQIGFTQSPELLLRITDIKAGLAQLDLLIAESTQQTNVAISQTGGIPQVIQNLFWWFRALNRRRAIGVSQNQVVSRALPSLRSKSRRTTHTWRFESFTKVSR
jgi:hypothetical protein